MNYDVSPGYFEAAGTTLLAGRAMTWHDDKNAPDVAVVNREFARKVFGSVDKAIGGHFKFAGGIRAEVVGVVEDGKYKTLTEDPMPAMFFPILQQTSAFTWMVVRSQRDPQEIAGALERTLHGVDPGLPLMIETWNQQLNSALFAARVATEALGVLGLLGAMLAVTGIFGMAAYTVSRRKKELGIRMALGARKTQVMSAAVGRPMVLLGVGSVLGLFAGVLASRLLGHIVYQANPRDPVVVGGAVLTMALLGIAASAIPARRALAVDPSNLMREE